MTNKITDGECYVCEGRIVWRSDKRGNAYYACGGCQTRVFVGADASDALKQQAKGENHGKTEKIQADGAGHGNAETGTGDGTAAASAGGKPASGGFGFFGI